ncbi:MAG: hypothetical protein ABII07_00610 [Patescibacteria group bacterium]|nr:hypothetical protein [Patescibacteria group bacterium]
MSEIAEPYEAKPFNPEECAASQKVAALTRETDEAVIRETFIKWCREVLKPMVEDIKRDLEENLENIPGNKRYIKAAIKTLGVYEVYYDEILNKISEACDLGEFLSFMETMDFGLRLNWANVNEGMHDAKRINRYNRELWTAIIFRENESKRLLTDGNCLHLLEFDHAVAPIYRHYLSEEATKALGELGDCNNYDADILSEFWHSALQPALADFYQFCTEQYDYIIPDFSPLFRCPSREGDVPPSKDRLLVYFTGVSQTLSAVLDNMDVNIVAQSDIQVHIQNLRSMTDRLEINLSRITTRDQAVEASS